MTKQDALRYAEFLTAWAEGKTLQARKTLPDSKVDKVDWFTITGDMDIGKMFLWPPSDLRIKPGKVKLAIYATREGKLWRYGVTPAGSPMQTEVSDAVYARHWCEPSDAT